LFTYFIALIFVSICYKNYNLINYIILYSCNKLYNLHSEGGEEKNDFFGMHSKGNDNRHLKKFQPILPDQ
jgi:hypothetical protein